jgi:hypothetical protein
MAVEYRDFEALADNRSALVIQQESLGKGGIAAILLITLLSVVMAALAVGKADRAMDRATIAEREARIAQDKYFYVASQLSKIDPSFKTDEH